MNKKTIFIIIIVGLLIMIAFSYLGNSGTSTSSTSLTATQSGSESADAQYIYSLLQQMNQVKLEDTVFSDPSFLNLKDNTVSFSAQPSGRDNPFSPVGSVANTNQSSTTIKVRIK